MNDNSTKYAKWADARARLVASARHACAHGIPQDTWKNSEVVIKFVREVGLPDSTIEHIASWVWTFTK